MAENLTLYRKYRPKTFKEVVGQDHIKKTLQNELKRGQIAHAYIFSGPRGIGKTTLARLLAKSLNCLKFKNGEPDNRCENCKSINEGQFLDLIEIDAASHTGVDNIRELIERVKLSPSIGKYKVYIIDEAHMLSRGAFNALLKTLEEPPPHAIFILATTEIFRFPETIISRCERFDFQKPAVKEIEERLKVITKKEKVNIEKEALSLIARAARGAIRDAESLFSQIISFGSKRIKEEEIKTFLGITDKSAINDFVNAIAKKDSRQAILLINKLSSSGYDLEEFTKDVTEHLRELLLVKTSQDLIEFSESILTDDEKKALLSQSEELSNKDLLKALKLFIIAQNEIKGATYPELPLEMVVIELCGENGGHEETTREPSVQERKFALKPEKKERKIKKVPAKIKSKNKKNNRKGSVAGSLIDEVKKNWNKIIYRVRDKNASLAAFLKSTQPTTLKSKKLLLFAPFGFYKERLLAAENRHLIEEIISHLVGQKISIDAKTEAEFIRFGIDLPEDEEKKEKKKTSEKIASDAIQILGGELVD